MKRKKFWLIKPVNVLLIALSIMMCAVLFFVNLPLFFVFTPAVLFGAGWDIWWMWQTQKKLYGMITAAGRASTDSGEAGLIHFPIPCVIAGETGEIIWYNDKFRETVLPSQNDIFGGDIRAILARDVTDLPADPGAVIHYREQYFETYCLKTEGPDFPLYIVYMVEITSLERCRLDSARQKPVVMLVMIDNYDESIGNENEAGKTKLLSDVRGAIQSFVDGTSGFIRKLEHDKYLVVLEKGDLDEIVKGRFAVLDKVRELPTENRVSVTLSIGVAPLSESFAKAEFEARQALDMALGRGGDQAAIRSEGSYEFFGGYSKGVEKRTKVKTRIVASAMVELIKAADNILVMGHRFADLDSLGSAIGMAKACQCFGKRANIVLDSRRNLADVMVRRLAEENEQQLVCQPDMAADLVTDKTLLFIVDTHSESLLESIDIYKRCKQVIVIDHHRKLVSHIDGAVIFYHEPYASSASEMVAELVQYFGDNCRLGNLEADALLAGIMLDTKNFVVKTGVRTFEAAAYLRRLGADTVEVRQLFSATMDSYQRKSRIVSSAGLYKGCAVSTCDFVSDDLRIVAPQAADELLGISGVKASFVMYEEGDSVNISARSMGAVNVQVIMEKLGGGGHHTMAGAQVQGSSSDKVKQALLEAIDQQEQGER